MVEGRQVLWFFIILKSFKKFHSESGWRKCGVAVKMRSAKAVEAKREMKFNLAGEKLLKKFQRKNPYFLLLPHG